jgi:hypothetical protein
MRRRTAQPPSLGRMQELVYRFKRAEKPRETLPQMRGSFTLRHKVALPELVR